MMLIYTLKRMADNQRFSTPAWLAVVPLLLLLGACSKTQWLYANADWMLERYAVTALDVNDTQLENWRPVLAQVVHQHLNREIPILEGYLELVARAVDESPDSPINAACLVNGAHLVFSRHVRLVADLAVPLMVQLNPRQIEHFSDYLAERRNRFRERYLQGDESERLQARVLRLTRRIERWTGVLESGQQSLIEQLALSLPDITTDWLGYRKRQEERLLQLLYEGVNEAALRDHIVSWLVPWDRADHELASKWTMAESAFVLFLDDLALSLSDRQWKHFRIELSSLRKELTVLLIDAPHGVKQTANMLQCNQLARAIPHNQS